MSEIFIIKNNKNIEDISSKNNISMESIFNILETKDVNSETKIQIWEQGAKLERKIVSLKDLFDDPDIKQIISNNIEIPSGSTIELANNLTTTAPGKALDSTQGKFLFDIKMNRLQNGSGYVEPTQLQTLVGLGFDLSFASLNGAYLEGANLYGAYLYGANLNGATLSYASLNGANLDGANLGGASLGGANLDGANLNGAILTSAEMSYVTLYGANLDNANLEGANLDNANLDNANLTYANLTNANLTNALGLDGDINIALIDINKDPSSEGGGYTWNLTWTDGLTYTCDATTGIFTVSL